MQTTIRSNEEAPVESSSAATSGSAQSLQAAILFVLLVVAFWPILTSMYGSWFDENAYMDHGLLVAPAAAYMVWTKWPQLVRAPRAPSGWGFVLLFLGALQATLGLAAHWVWVGRMAFLVSLVGLVVGVYGFRMAKALAFPLSLLIFMIAPPTFVYERLTLKLQLLASLLGEAALDLMGYSVVREGNILELVGAKLSIEEACSGLRSLLSITFMCTLYGYFFAEGNGMRAFLLVMAVPIAILGNVLRIVATGVASQYDRALLHGTAHDVFGYISIGAAAIGCLLLHGATVKLQKRWRVRHG